MSFMKKLCDVYDAVIDTDGAKGDGALLPVGFVQKKIKYNIIFSPSGEFVTAQLIPDGEQSCAVPSSPQAEARASSKCAPFPLAEQLKYLISGKGSKYFDSYVAQLETWCAEEHAPNCLHVLLDYLKKKTLYADLAAVSGFKLKYYKDESDTKGDGADAKSFACFSIEYPDSENRLWMRRDVRESWARRLAAMTGEQTTLCYVTGLQLPAMENHPKVQGNAKLISAKDDDFPFQFRGRFVADRSAATVSGLASSKAHSALRWLLNHQGFQKYGMNFVGWYTDKPALGDDEDGERLTPDTFESYINALFSAVQGYEKNWKVESDLDDLTDEARAAMDEVVILGLQAATDGRMSVTYEQELPGNVFIDHVERWRIACRWQMPHQEGLADDRPPTWREICEAVMGIKAVKTALGDTKAEKAATKLMRDLQLRLLHCVVEAEALPRNMVEAAFHRAVQPLAFTDSKGRWNDWSWSKCVAVACAMIRKYEIDRHIARLRAEHRPVPPLETLASQPVLDVSNTERDYLYGRLLAVAHKLEQDASNDSRTNAVRMMARFVQRPDTVWPQMYAKLIPYLNTLGSQSAEGRTRTAHGYQCLLGQIEGLFRPKDIDSIGELSYSFLLGFSAQTRELWLGADKEHQSQPPQTGLQPPASRDALYGCLLAVADHLEWSVEIEQIGERRISVRDGRTNAQLMTSTFERQPLSTWVKIHDKLIPYLEKAGVKNAGYALRLIGRIEQGFSPAERLSDAPLGRGFLHGYLTMLCALSTRDGLDQAAWKPENAIYKTPESREAAFGALLALENGVERRILDLDKPDEENRPSNAMRFLARAAQQPDEVRAYLVERMRPYARKLWYSAGVLELARDIERYIAENHWNSDKPLGSQYLYYFYLYSQISF